jgi:WNK lysine deficient protein kinase
VSVLLILAKCRYKAYDTEKGVEVAWNVTSMKRLKRDDLKRIYMEVELLKNIEHENIIKMEEAWVNKEKQEAVFITELVTAGALTE